LKNNLQSRIPFLAGICTAHPWSSTGKSIDVQFYGLQMAEKIQTFTIPIIITKNKVRSIIVLENTMNIYHPNDNYFIIEMLI
jgi:hypothetical protein